MKLAVFHLF